jgi:oligopeptide transport system permease protein
MISFIIRRVFFGVLVILLVITSTFFLLRLLPGGPFDKEKKLPEEIKINIERKFHLDKPLHQQFLIYISGVLKGDFGPSYKFLHRTANDIIKDTFPVSLKLGLTSFILSLFLGIVFGTLSAFRFGRFFEFVVSFGISLPSFVVASLLIIIFSLSLNLVPPALFEGWKYMVLPVITLSFGPTLYIAKLTRTSVLSTLQEDFTKFAKSKGIGDFRFFLHVISASLSSVFSVAGLLFAFMITGSFIVETVFAIPGMGRYFVLSVIDRDYPVVMALTIVFTTILVFANILSEILYVLFDPRAREKI